MLSRSSKWTDEESLVLNLTFSFSHARIDNRNMTVSVSLIVMTQKMIRQIEKQAEKRQRCRWRRGISKQIQTSTTSTNEGRRLQRTIAGQRRNEGESNECKAKKAGDVQGTTQMKEWRCNETENEEMSERNQVRE